MKRTLSLLPILIVIIGAITRIVVYFQNRSLFIDEANLARNFVEKSYADFFTPLDYYQYSPPLFSFIEKFFLQIMGVHEYALRFFPLLCGVLVLWYFYKICDHLLDNIWLKWFPIWLFSFSAWFIRYGTEVKQYSSDIAMGVILIYIALFYPRLKTWIWALIGGIAMWLSMSVVFVLAGIGLFFFIEQLIEKNKAGLLSWMFIGIAWLLSFIVYYTFVLSPNVNSGDLQSYHTDFFLPLLPNSVEEWDLTGDLLLSIFKTGFGFTVFSYLIGIGGFLIGVGYLTQQFFTKNKRDNSLVLLLLLVTPIIACLVASMFQFYSLMPRLMLFFIPFVLIINALGLEVLLRKGNEKLKYIVVVLLLLVAGNRTGFIHLFQPYLVEEIKPILTYLKDNYQQTDEVYVFHEAEGAFRFYTQLHEDKEQYDFLNIHVAKWNEDPDELINDVVLKPKKIWLLYTHLLSNESIQMMQHDIRVAEMSGNTRLVMQSNGGALYLWVAP